MLALVLALLSPSAGPVRAADPLDPFLGDPGTTLPNVVPDLHGVLVQPSFVFDETTQTFTSGPPQLLLDTAAKNLGSVPLQLTVDDPVNAESSTVSQCVSWRADHVCREQRLVDELKWVNAHGEFEYDGFITYQFRALLSSGRVDYSPRGLLFSGERTLFCLRDYERAQETASPVPFYETCFPTTLGISPGWLDKYDFSLPGQKLLLPGLTDGRYALVISMDNDNRLRETRDDDNVVEIVLEFSGNMTQVAVVDRRYP